ncbi:ketoacyl-ACP synthase III family protein [Micromonospora sp. WMMD882]|uniref:ketoacyl-ACP synthase III family protein n=1 Tax=Micromonospora sp. WMMD882 TaxID=3015151 RepID=UPI00248C0DF2|nr:ketoacyl-ACP synthase III family protein [Micromonospora sp. WMMD882]WBB81895.1 ketoacyl-ACP synthase III family protein [Micromonospora sp. WMMD882]
MRLKDVHIASIGVHLGRSVDLAEAVAAGRYDEAEYTANGLVRAVVAEDEFPADMAVTAVRQAMDRCPVDPADIRLMLHASLFFQGQDMWTPASYIQRYTIGGAAPSIEVDQKSSGGTAALGLAVSYLSNCDPDSAVLITTADRFGEPGWDRFRSESGTVMGDGATATVLTRRPGFARVLSTVLTADPTLEEMYRGDGFKTAAHSGDKPMDLRRRKKAFMRGRMLELEQISLRIASGVGDCMRTALEEADTKLDDVSRVVLPNIGLTVRWWSVLKEMGVERDRTSWDWGRTIGHLGAGDQFAGLEHLVRQGQVRPGDRVVLAASGHGFNWGAAVVEILDTPDWAATPA